MVCNTYFCLGLVLPGEGGYKSNISKPSLPAVLSLSIESTDFALRDTPVRLVGGFSDVRLDASNDDVTLEIGDTVILRLDTSIPNIVDLVEQQGQFLRENATVTLLDNDCKQPLQIIIENCFVTLLLSALAQGSD